VSQIPPHADLSISSFGRGLELIGINTEEFAEEIKTKFAASR
jgi:hypothetical protein